MTSLSSWFENLLFNGAGEECSPEPGPDGKLASQGKLRKKTVVTVIGSGGKTSLIWHLAASLASPGPGADREKPSPGRRSVLVTPTTKMQVPPESAKLYDRYFDGKNHKGSGIINPETVYPEPAPGVTLAGIYNESIRKLESLPLEDLERIIPGYDLVLIEGDGSREHPLKAWSGDEPVVPDFTDLTIGVLPLWPLGKPVSRKIIHRLPLFLALTGTVPGEPLKFEHILKIITGKESHYPEPAVPGLFAKARGKKLLFFNQVENEAALKHAQKTIDLLPVQFVCSLSGIIAGSVRQNSLAFLTACSNTNGFPERKIFVAENREQDREQD